MLKGSSYLWMANILRQGVFGNKSTAAGSRETRGLLLKHWLCDRRKDWQVALLTGRCAVWRHRKRKHCPQFFLGFPALVTEQVHARCHLPWAGNITEDEKKKNQGYYCLSRSTKHSMLQHAAQGKWGELRLPREREGAKRETVAPGSAWVMGCSLLAPSADL